MSEIIPIIDTILTSFGVFYFLFAIFRRLKEDYPQQEVVRMSVFSAIISIGLIYLFSRLNVELIFFAVVLSVVLVVLLFSKKNKWRFWAVMEYLTLPGMIAWFLFSFGNWFQMGAVAVVLASNLYWKNYRRFSWYSSGKIGFIFLMDLVQFSLIQVALDFWQNRLIELSSWIVLFWLSIAGIIFRGGQGSEN